MEHQVWRRSKGTGACKKRTPGVVVKEFGVREGQGMPSAWALPMWEVGHLGFLTGEMDLLWSRWGDKRGAAFLENLVTQENLVTLWGTGLEPTEWGSRGSLLC